MMISNDIPPSSIGGWSETIEAVNSATIVPPAASGFQQKAGILAFDGRYCATGALWRRHRPLTLAPDPATPKAALQGRWLWGGVLWAHFGHFLAESTARLWALNSLDGPIDGVVFMPKRPRNGEKMTGYQTDFLRLMGVDGPVRVVTEPTSVEELLVPGQGFGLGEISAGTQKVRDHFAASFARDVAPEGPEKLYVSRSALGFEKGSIIGETYIEDRLAEEGYEIFHPQAHPMEVQIARYRAARQVVATDGSALHLLAMSQPKGQRLAIVARRKSSAIELLYRHIASFTQADPLLVGALRRAWFPDGRKSNRRLALGELNLADVGQQLQDFGYITGGHGWSNLSDADVRSALESTGRTWHLKPWQKRLDAKSTPPEPGAESSTAA
ncbi:MAG: glycosyltransferase 61 family protein [Pseudomonadota bacterium]